MKKIKFGLIGKIAVLVGVVELIAFTLLSYIYAEKYGSYIETSMMERVHQINKMLANEEMPLSSLAQRSYMDSMLGNPYIDGFAIGNTGIIIVSSNPIYLGRNVNTTKDFDKSWLFKSVGERFITKNDKLISISFLNSEISSVPLYRTVIITDINNISNSKNRILFFGLATSMIFVLFSSFAIVFLAQRFVAKRINESLDVLKAVENGNLDAQISVTRSDELALLQDGINSMIKTVANLLSGYKKSIEKVQIVQQKVMIQKEEFESIFKYSKDGIAITDLESNFLDCNEAYCDILGFSKEEMLQTSCLDLGVPEDYEKNAQVPIILAQKGYIKNLEKTCIKKDKQKIVTNMSLVLLPDKQRVLISMKDMSYLMKMEEQAKLASMGEMIGNIAHQWRQPLSVISTVASSIKLKNEFNMIEKDEITTLSDKIVEQAKYLSKTIDDFKNFIKGDLKFEQISVVDVVNSTLSLTSATMANNYINIITSLDDDILFKGNKNEFEQALINILNNSKDVLKDNIENQDERFIFIDTKMVNQNYLELTICDNGGGISEEIIHRIFEPYFTTKHQSVGTGLGLAMAHKIITERHAQSISVFNREFEYKKKQYKGVCFIITFSIEK